MPQEYLQYAGVVLALASLLISGLAPRFAEFTIAHDDFARRARLVSSICRAARQESLYRGIVETLDTPGSAVLPDGDLAAHARIDAQALGLEFRGQRLVTGERRVRLIIVVDMVLAVLVAAASLLLPQYWLTWAGLALFALLTMIGSYVWLFYLCNHLETVEEEARGFTTAQE